MINRRHFLSTTSKTIGATTAISALSLWSTLIQAEELKVTGAPEHFDLEALKAKAKQMASQPYEAHNTHLPEAVTQLSWDQYQSIQFKNDHTLWAEGSSPLAAKFFHLGLFFKTPVQMHQVVNGQAQELAYDPAMFSYGQSGLDGSTRPENPGFAGFRILDKRDMTRDIAAFLGASYFRAVGVEKQYGLSSRGLAVDTAMPYAEEFPEFIAFWLEKPAPGAKGLNIYALLDSPSVAGAYRFTVTQSDTLTMDVAAFLYPRKEIARMGIGPCTSMYQYGENDKRMAWDWRPEIHDSDGLQMHTGNGEWLWRPLANPANLRFNAFQDSNPKGFGLIQRDRHFDHYQDDGVFYERRPSLWVEPQGAWGEGSVDLVEIPTVDETFDNIVAFWTPKEKPQAGDELSYQYKLHWGGIPPASSPLAKCVDTYTGLGGVVGQKRTYYSQRFVVDFVGPILEKLPEGAKVNAIVSASCGDTQMEVELVSARPQHEKKGYRAMFDLRPDDSTDQIDIRLYLESEGQVLTETWLYQWNPPPVSERKLY